MNRGWKRGASRSKWVVGGLAVTLAATATACGSFEGGGGGGGGEGTIRALIPHPGEPVPFALRTFRVVDDKSYLADSGVKVKESGFENFAQMPALVSAGDSAEMANTVGISSVLPAWKKGARNFRVIAVDNIRPIYQLVTASDVTKISQLNGKVIGTLGPTAAGTDASDVLLDDAGLGGKYKETTVGAGSAALSALDSGAIKGITYSPPFSTELEDKGYHVVGDMANVVTDYITGMTIVNEKWAKSHRKEVVAYLSALLKAGDWYSDPKNKSDVVSYLQSKWPSGGGGTISKPTAEAMYDYYIKDRRVSFDGYAPEKAVESNLGISVARGLVKKNEIPEDFAKVFDWSYLNEALKEAGRQPVPQYGELTPAEVGGGNGD